MSTAFVTGASGFIGGALTKRLVAEGWSVKALVRSEKSAKVVRALGADPIKGDLDDVSAMTAGAAGADVAFHSAAHLGEWGNAADFERVNVTGTANAVQAARDAGVPRFVFVSTTSAHADARSYYGQSKFRLEGTLEPSRDLVVRPGLVVSRRGGLFQRMAGGRAGSSWVVPLFDGGTQPMQTIFVDDLCEGVVRAIERDAHGSLVLASPERMTVREFFAAVAAFGKRTPRFVDVPAGLALAMLRTAEMLRIPLPVSSENLLGMLSLRYWDAEPDLARLDLRVRPLGETLAALGRPI